MIGREWLMLSELKKNRIKVLSLFKELDHYLEIKAVIAGICPGRIFVDDLNNPKSAFLVGFQNYEGESRFYLAGKVSESFAIAVKNLIT